MTLGEVQKLLQAEILTGVFDPFVEISMIKASDLMSDVLTCCESGALLLTGLTNAQTVRTAELIDLCGIVFARGKIPSEEIVHLAEQSEIPLLATSQPMYKACGILYTYQESDGKDKHVL